MTYTTIILILGVIAAFIYLILARVKDIYCTLIVSFQILTIGLILTVSQNIGYYIFVLTIVLSLLYPNIKKVSMREEKKWIWLFLFPIFISFIFKTFNLPGYGIVRLLMLLPIGIFIYALTKTGRFKKEISFMIIFTAIALTELIQFFDFLSD